MGIPMLKIRRSQDRLIFNMGIPILVRRHLYIETVPRLQLMLSKDCKPWVLVNTSWPRQNDRHSADIICKCIFLKENVWISFKISLKFVPKVQISNIPAFVQIMARRTARLIELICHCCWLYWWQSFSRHKELTAQFLSHSNSFKYIYYTDWPQIAHHHALVLDSPDQARACFHNRCLLTIHPSFLPV